MNRRDFAGLCAGALSAAVSPAAGPEQSFTITKTEMAAKPISPLLYSNFVELGYGIQVEPMWGEMFFNRSFEPFPPYKGINIEWFDLWIDPRDHSKGFKTDWTREDWYHSGYQHNPWFAAPGEEGPFHVDNNSTFVVEKSPVLDMRIRMVENEARHGTRAMEMTNGEAAKWGALAQSGKLLHKGETYHFRGQFKSAGGPVNAEVRFYPHGNWEKPLATIPLRGISGTWEEKTLTWKNSGYDGWATFSLWIPPGTSLMVDDLSLMPASTVRGWRPEVVEAVRRVKPGVIRFPGGCFASFYDWRDAVGPYSHRKPQPSYFWGGQNYNDVGTAEFATLCNHIGSEMMFVVNMFHPRKRKYDHYFDPQRNSAHGYDFPQFTDVEQGAKLAADWVAYCNLPAGKHPMADLRAQHGYAKPFSVKFWEFDNEVNRWFTPEEYAKATVTYSKAMKAVDPTIQIGMVTYSTPFPRLETMLEIAGKHFDFMADRRDAEVGLDRMLTLMRDYNQRAGTRIRYCETEKLFIEKNASFPAQEGYTGEVTKSFNFGKWYYGLNVLREYMSYQRRGGDVMYVNFNNLANTHSQCVIDTPKEGAYLSAAGRAMEMLSHSPAAWPLELEGYAAKLKDEFQVQAAWDLDRKRLVLYVFNRTPELRNATFNLAGLDRVFRRAEVTMLSAGRATAMNTLQQPDAVKRTVRTDRVGGTSFRVDAPKWSFIQVLLS